MSMIRTLAEKPWLAVDSAQDMAGPDPDRWPAKTALKFFLAVVTVLFMLFAVTFLSRSQAVDFQALAGEPWLPFNDLTPLWFNTGVLLLAGSAMQFAVSACKKQQQNVFILAIFAACLLTVGFIFGQINVWQALGSQGFLLASNPANSYFYLLTGIHSVHLFGGVLALLRVVWLFWRSHAHTHTHTQVQTHTGNGNKVLASLRLCALYWHYLFIVWLFLFALLTGDSATYKTIALYCGF